jgi:predicted amidohydrolase
MVVDPYGRPVLALDPYRECTGTVEISLEQLQRFREKFQVWRDSDDFQIFT